MITQRRFITVYILLILSGLYINLHADVAVPVNKSFSEFPAKLDGWQMTADNQFADNILNVLRPTDYLSREYRNTDGRIVNLYLGYHGGGKGAGGIHSPRHCLPGSGWYEASMQRRTLQLPDRTINLVEAIYQKGEHKELFLYWFQVQDKSLSDEYSLKLAEITNSMINRRRDSTFIRISVPFDTDSSLAINICEKFIKDFYPIIKTYLPG